jgi:threonine dehydrogenase-like Zn-dependent dehydrogenase
MRGVTFPGGREVAIRDFPDPTPGEGEVVVEIKASGMCGSDLHNYRRPKESSLAAPIIVGHEPCGVIAAVGPGVPPAEARVGDRVMVHHYWGCAVCEHCRGGWAQMCNRMTATVFGRTGHGAHAPYMKMPARTMVALPESLSFSAGAAIACGTGTAYGALRRIRLSGRDTIAIFGQGPVGLSATQLAVAMGARVIALDVSAERLARAREFGADAVIDPARDDAVEAIRALTRGLGADLSLDTSSAPSARQAAVQCVRAWGTACYVGEGGNVTLDVSPDMLRRQVSVVGSWTFSTMGQAECAAFIADRGIDVDHLFTHQWKLDQAEEAYTLFDRQTAGKGMFLM